MHNRTLLCLALVVGAAASASLAAAQEAGTVRWSAQVAMIDFSQRDSAERFAGLIREAQERTILYLDWTFKNAARSEIFASIVTQGGTFATDEQICGHVERSAARSGGLTIRGKPDPANHYLLLEMMLDIESGAPFARARCEYVPSVSALRLRGFFYVTSIGTATADKLEFMPVSVPAHQVPETFLKHLQ
ncbi:hypothetical protein [Pelagibacterium lacus]|uniref:Uncharacterized protein n=1 Tax=Pelagibacterium lacus TaxID=2282655 RepID=A0A369VZU3_9HYPH|nr:hypothetical protein [Pelagibacterium lacus]RDE07934.1 hypothetical protein DVH29_14110 [Pelagibacterium lacus]